MKNYGFIFQYRTEQGAEPIRERLFITSRDKDAENACTVAMLQFIKKNGYFSGKIVRIINF